MTTSSELPAADELEVTLLGRGVGESCVIHVGHGVWIIVDSFMDRGRPAAQRYLEDHLRVPSCDVRHIIVTHFHRDHYEGVEELFDVYQQAALGVTSVVDREDFMKLHFDKGNPSLLGGLPSVMERARKRPVAGVVNALRRLQVAVDVIDAEIEGDQMRVRALSPSEAAAESAIDELAALLQAGVLDTTVRSRLRDKNRASVALHVKALGHNVLLGADLVAGPSDFGWQAVLDEASAEHGRLSSVQASSLFKIPHHGSENAHHSAAWDRLVESDATLLVSPFSNKSLPTDGDCTRLLRLGDLWQSAPSTKDRSQVEEVAGHTFDKPSAVGRVQARLRKGDTSWTVTCDPPAFHHDPGQSS